MEGLNIRLLFQYTVIDVAKQKQMLGRFEARWAHLGRLTKEAFIECGAEDDVSVSCMESLLFGEHIDEGGDGKPGWPAVFVAFQSMPVLTIFHTNSRRWQR